ncbi:MAG: C4-dicarboxylate ABC transporter, partial [Betaproteobacteria bacterium]
YDALPQELKSVIDYAVQAASADMSWKAEHRYSQDYIELRTKDKVNFFKTPDSVLRAQLAAWDRVIAKKTGDNPFFKRVLDSQRAFAERVCRWSFDTNVDFRMAFNHYFGRPAAAPAKGPAK